MSNAMNVPLLFVENMIQHQDSGFRLRVPRFQVFPGKSYAITGPNGAGKTTLLKTLAFLSRPVKGVVEFDGMPVTPDNGLEQRCRRQTTLVMQDAYLFRTSVFNNIAYGLRIRGESEDTVRMKVDSALDAVGLSAFGTRKAHSLSRGEAQRIAIARALALEPRLLLLDEPTANVDAASAEMIEHVITRTMISRGAAVVFSTHQIEQAYRLADEIVSLRGGVMLETGPMNLFAGDVEHGADGPVVRFSPTLGIRIVTAQSGSVHIRIPPEDIIISMSPLESSARNSFPGVIMGAGVEDDQIRLDLDIGITLSAIITRQSFAEMGLAVGDAVYVTFKTSAVQVY